MVDQDRLRGLIISTVERHAGGATSPMEVAPEGESCATIETPATWRLMDRALSPTACGRRRDAVHGVAERARSRSDKLFSTHLTDNDIPQVVNPQLVRRFPTSFFPCFPARKVPAGTTRSWCI